LAFDLGLVIGSSEVERRYPPHHLSPAWHMAGRAVSSSALHRS
jgi:hypothetical protein